VYFAKREAPSTHTPFVLPGLCGMHVLCVDDNATNRTILQRQLRAWGMEVHCMADGQTALGELRTAHRIGRPYVLAILDYQMPGLDGLTLARSIKADPDFAEIVLVLLSSVLQRGQRQAAHDAGIAVHLTKPIRQSSLYTCLVNVMDGAALKRQVTPSEQPHAAPMQPLVRSRVLVVEDNIVNQKLAQRMLEKLGCRVDVVANGREAVDTASQMTYDLVFMDCLMPVMDGYEATAVMRAHERQRGGHLPIIAMTANALQGDCERCLEAGMDDYISKPVQGAVLAAMLQKWAPSASQPSDRTTAAEANTSLPASGDDRQTLEIASYPGS
jgi:two-component system, sensor histidine kinase and response regulator